MEITMEITAAVTTKPAFMSKSKIKRNPRKFAEGLTVSKLLSILKYLDYSYEEKDNSPVSDEDYDILRGVLEERSPNNKYLQQTGVAPTKKKAVKGSPVYQKVKLPAPMPSLSKIKPGATKLYTWLDGHTGAYCVSDKLDGISIEIVYENHVPAQAFTRGNGVVGNDISGIIPHLKIPKKIPQKNAVVRGEFIMSQSRWNAKDYMHESGKKKYDTSRNMAGGVLRRCGSSSHNKLFRTIMYQIVGGPGSEKKVSSQLKQLKAWKFDVVDFKVFKDVSEAILSDYHDSRKGKTRYDIDGIVVFRDTPYKQVKPGTLPQYAMAFKKNSKEDMKQVKVTQVEWRVSRYGKIIPRVHVDPVTLGGVTVQHFTGHNAYYILHGFKKDERKKGTPVRPINVGATIRVVRSGDVIPYIVEVVKPARKAAQPEVAFKVKGEHYVIDKAQHGADEAHTMNWKQIQNFFGKLDIEGLKQGTIEKLINAGFDSIKAITRMSVDDFLTVDGIKDKTAQTLHSNIKKGIAQPSFAKLADASGMFEGIGSRRLDAIEAAIPDIMTRKMSTAELTSIVADLSGFKELAAVFAKQFKPFKKWAKQHKFKTGVPVRVEKVGKKMEKHVVGFSGVRDKDLMSWIASQGGTVGDGVTKATTILVMKTTGTGSSKEQKALDRGLPIYTLDEFKKKFKVT